MPRTRELPPQDFDPDATDRLPVLEPDQDELEDTGEWSHDDLAGGPAGGGTTQTLNRLPEEVADDEQAAVTELTRALRDKSLAVARLQRDLDQARAEVGRLARGTTPELARLESRLREVERERLELAAQHDERRTALAALEDQLGELREAQQQSARELARVRDEAAAAEAAREQASARAEELAAELGRVSRAAMSEAQEQEQQRLKARISELRNALAVARDELDLTAQERDLLKQRVEHRVGEFIELKEEIAQRDGRIASLLERLRTAEALRRFRSDFRARVRHGADGEPRGSAGLAARVAELERLLAAERDARARAEAAASQPPAPAVGSPDDREPTIAGEDREPLRSRLSELAAEVSRRDDRIATLESDLRSQSSAIDTIRHGLGLLPEGGEQPQRGQAGPCCYLTRLDDGDALVHVLSQPRVSIGRTRDNDLQVREKYISRHHAVIIIGPETAIVEDAGSSNGVFVNDRRINRELLEDGDILALGTARYRFQVRKPDAATG